MIFQNLAGPRATVRKPEEWQIHTQLMQYRVEISHSVLRDNYVLDYAVTDHSKENK